MKPADGAPDPSKEYEAISAARQQAVFRAGLRSTTPHCERDGDGPAETDVVASADNVSCHYPPYALSKNEHHPQAASTPEHLFDSPSPPQRRLPTDGSNSASTGTPGEDTGTPIVPPFVALNREGGGDQSGRALPDHVSLFLFFACNPE